MTIQRAFWSKNTVFISLLVLILLFPYGYILAGEAVGISSFSVFQTSAEFSIILEDSTPERRRYRREEKRLYNAKQEDRWRKIQMNLPDMEVREITHRKYKTDTGGRIRHWTIKLEDPNNPNNYVTFSPSLHYLGGRLRYLRYRNNHPLDGLKEGDRVVFDPHPRNHGWMLRDDRGKALTFIHVNAFQLESFSESF